MNQDFERLKDKTSEPTEETVRKFIGKQTSKAWICLRQFIEDNYDFKPDFPLDSKTDDSYLHFCIHYILGENQNACILAFEPVCPAGTTHIVITKSAKRDQRFSTECSYIYHTILQHREIHPVMTIFRSISSENTYHLLIN